MNFEIYTERARGFVQSAQALATREGHQQFTPEHLLKVLMDDPEGLCSGLIQRAGGNPTLVRADVEAALGKLPKVSGGSGQVYLSQQLAKVFETAEQAATKAGVTPQTLNAAIEALRKGRTADTATAENAYDALKKFARDLTQAVRDGKDARALYESGIAGDY